jgi:uncharacterized membrane protein YccC
MALEQELDIARQANAAALRDAWEAGRDAAAAWHYKRACETPDVFEQEFHEVSHDTIRALTPPAPEGSRPMSDPSQPQGDR